MNKVIQSWKKLWKDLDTRRWIFLFFVGLLLVVIAVPVEKLSAKGQSGYEATGSNNTGSQTSNQQNFSIGITKDPGKSTMDDTGISATIHFYEAELESRLTQLLSQIEGAGEVQVMVTVSRSSELILQTDTSREENTVKETDSQGGNRDNTELREESQTVLTGGGATAQPYVVGEIMPQVEGVVVACQGGDRPTVQAEISAAVQALFDLAPHKIKVCKMASP